jgi:hypothetical protein
MAPVNSIWTDQQGNDLRAFDRGGSVAKRREIVQGSFLQEATHFAQVAAFSGPGLAFTYGIGVL